MWLIAYILGAIEMALITCLMVKVIVSGGWWYFGVIALIVYLFTIGGRVSQVFVTLAITISLAFIYIGFGLIAATLSFVAFTVFMEAFPQFAGKRKDTNEVS